MNMRHPKLPDIWLVGDARNDERLGVLLKHLPRGSGFIFRQYHLERGERYARWIRLVRIARSQGHVAALAATAGAARNWGALAAYGPPERLAAGPVMLRLVAAHSLREIAMAHRARADAVLISPVFATRSHPGAKPLGPVRLRLLAKRAKVPVIALGGMSKRRSRALAWKKWAAIDGI